MPAPRLHIDQALAAHTEITLADEAARYVGRVLRCRPGDALLLFDGSGSEFAAIIDRIDKQNITVHVQDAVARDVESPLDVRLLQGVSRGERMDIVVQKATELGVRRITPLQTEFSVVRLDANRAAKRQQHWQRISESACEQCGRTVPPTIDTAVTLPDFFSKSDSAAATRLMLLPGAAKNLVGIEKPAARVELLIGPEGGFSDGEQKQALANGFVPVAIGPRVLRTETAALAALTLVQALWGDLG